MCRTKAENDVMERSDLPAFVICRSNKSCLVERKGPTEVNFPIEGHRAKY